MDHAHSCVRLTGIEERLEEALASSKTPPSNQSKTLPEPLRAWSGSSAEYPCDKTVAALFEEVVKEYPERIALVFKDSRLTYSELNTRANRLAHQLRRKGAGPETRIACCLERSADLIVGLLATLKAGAAYVPLDPTYPKNRLEFLLKDTEPLLVLTQSWLGPVVFAGRDLPLVFLDQIPPSPLDEEANPEPAGSATSLAYVMYTSGSTGLPKGVMVENRAIVRLVRNTNYCRFAPDEVFLQLAPVSFDASTFEIWGALLNGGRLVVMPSHPLSLEEIGSVIRTQGVTTLWLTSGLFSAMVDQRLDDLRPLRQLLTGGDVVSARSVRACLQELPHISLINGYGPTENTTFTCCHVMRAGDVIPDSVPIGRPISNTQVFILDSEMRPVLVGDTGELYAAGDGLARGYLNDPEGTSQKFLPNPFAVDPVDRVDPKQRIYRTGDLARWRDDGLIEFLGRIDGQVKILGHRVEPGEIEAAFRTHEGIKQICVVPCNDDGPNRLLAFYVPSSNPAPTPRELRDFAAKRLPRYMIPSQFVPLSRLPLSLNGKLDRRALAQLQITEPSEQGRTEPPATQIETTLAGFWREILHTQNIGLDDNFFDLGGDSLLLTVFHSRLQKALTSDIPLTDLFQFTTIRTLARHLTETNLAKSKLTGVRRQAHRQREEFARLLARQSGGRP